MTRGARAACRVVACVLALFAPRAVRAAAPMPAPQPVEESGAARAVVLGEGRVAGTVLWPAPAEIEGQALPRGTLAVAAHAVLQNALAGEPDARPLVEFGPDFVALGTELASNDEPRLFRILARLANPAPLAPPAVDAALQQVRQQRGEAWADPLERARIAALGVLFPGGRGGWNAGGNPGSLERVDAGDVEAALAAVRRRPVELRLAGPVGLAARAAAALTNRLGEFAEPHAPALASKLPASALLPGPGPGPFADQAALMIAFAVSAEDAEAVGPVLSVLEESLAEGQGSLPQRLGISSKDKIAALLDVVPVPGGGGVVLFGARVGRGQAAAAWRVLEGLVASLRALPLGDAAVYRAKQRLDEQAVARATDAGAALLALLRNQPWSWPPDDRDTPLMAAEVRVAALKVLTPGRRASVAVGSIGDDVLQAESFRAATRADWSTLEPLPATPHVPRRATPHVDDAAAGEARTAAAILFRTLADGKEPEDLPGFEASYRVRESTPLGPAETDLRIEGGPDGTFVDVARGSWRVQARGGEEGAEARVPDNGAALPINEPDRLPALVLREPALFAAAAMRGLVPIAEVEAKDGTATVPGLRAVLPEGTVLLLLLDPETRFPAGLRVWHLGHDARRAPDEEVRYTSWALVGGVRVAASLTVRDELGTTRDVRLSTWFWKSPSP